MRRPLLSGIAVTAVLAIAVVTILMTARPRPQADKAATAPTAPANRAIKRGTSGITPGSAPPSFTATTLDGRNVSPADYGGKGRAAGHSQIICPGCHRAHPETVGMQERYAQQGLEVLGLAVAFEYQAAQTPERIRRYVSQKGYPYPVAIDGGSATTFRRYRARGTPFTVLIDRQGRVRYLGFFRRGRVEAIVQGLLNETTG